MEFSGKGTCPTLSGRWVKASYTWQIRKWIRLQVFSALSELVRKYGIVLIRVCIADVLLRYDFITKGQYGQRVCSYFLFCRACQELLARIRFHFDPQVVQKGIRRRAREQFLDDGLEVGQGGVG